MKLTPAQSRELTRLAAGASIAAGYFDTRPERALLAAGLIERCDVETVWPGLGTATLFCARLTEAGWRTVEGRANEAQRQFMWKRGGTCDKDWEVFQSCLWRGWVEVVKDYGVMVKWKRTEEGKRVAGEVDE